MARRGDFGYRAGQRGSTRPPRVRVPVTDAKRQLQQRRSERTRRANQIKRLIANLTDGAGSSWPIADSAVPFWRDRVLYEDVRTLVRLVRDEWHWWSERDR